MKDLTYPLDRDSGVPLYEQLYRFISRDIAQGRLASGAQIPSRRELSRHLGISEQTVSVAYDLLKAEGFLFAQPRRGLFIEELQPLPIPPAAPRPAKREQPSLAPRFDFSPQAADIRLFPQQTWTRLIRETLIRQPELLSKGPAKGELSLREALSAFLYQYRGVRCEPENVIIGSGVDQLMGIIGTILEKPAKIGFEDPGYLEAARAVQRLGHTAHPLEMDEQGILLDAVEQSGVKAVYVTPAHQFPTGMSMPAGRRTELLLWAQEEEGRYILEDDYDSEFRYASRPLPALQAMGGDRTVYISTFSRTLAPGIRVAYMALPEELTKRYEALGLRSGDSVSRFEQRAMARLVSEGHYARHLRRAGAVYRKRCDVLSGRLSRIPGSRISGQEAGLHFMFGIEGRSEEELIEKAGRTGIPLKGLSSYCRKADLPPALVIGFAGIADEQINDAVALLRRAWDV